MWWCGHSTLALHMLEELQRQQQCNVFCDTLLQAEDLAVPVHSCILAACSPFLFRELSTFPPPVGQRWLVRVPATGARALMALVSFLYTGEMREVGLEEYEEVKAAINRLGMSHLIPNFQGEPKEMQTNARGLQLEWIGDTQMGTENTKSCTEERSGMDIATQTEAEHGATQSDTKKEKSKKRKSSSSKKVPGQDTGLASDRPRDAVKIKFKRRCKGALWRIEGTNNSAMSAQESSSGTDASTGALSRSTNPDVTQAQEHPVVNKKKTEDGSIVYSTPSQIPQPPLYPSLCFPLNLPPTTADDPDRPPSQNNKASPSLSHLEAEECDEQLDKLLDDIMMNLDIIQPITENGDSSLQPAPLSYLPADSTAWLGEHGVPMANGLNSSLGQMKKAVGPDLMLVPQCGTSLADCMRSVSEQSSALPPEPQCTQLPSPQPASTEPQPKADATSTHRYTPESGTARLCRRFSSLQSEEETTLRSKTVVKRATIQSESPGQQPSQTSSYSPSWLSRKPVDLNYALTSVLLHPSVTADAEPCVQPNVTKRGRRPRAVLQSEMVTGKRSVGKCTKSVVAKQKNPVKKKTQQNTPQTVPENPAEARLKNMVSKIRESKLFTKTRPKTSAPVPPRQELAEGLRESKLFTKTRPKTSAPAPPRQELAEGHSESSVDVKSISEPSVQKRRRGRPRKAMALFGVFSPTKNTITAVSKAAFTRTLFRTALEIPSGKQPQPSLRKGQEQGYITDSCAEETGNLNGLLNSKAVSKHLTGRANGLQRKVTANTSQQIPMAATVGKAVSNTPVVSSTTKRGRVLLDRNDSKRRKVQRGREKHRNNQNCKCPGKEEVILMNTPHENVMSAEMDKTSTQATEKGDGIGSGEEEDREEELDVDVISGSPVTLPLPLPLPLHQSQSNLVGREPSDDDEEEDDIDIVNIDGL